MTREQGIRPIDSLRLAEPLASQLRFLLEADGLKSVIRGSRIADGSRRENTAEHSWHIALFALVLAPHAAERIDVLRVVSMLLIHDLVEIDCGDEAAATADARFAKAIDRLQPILLNHAVGGGTWSDYDVDEARERALTCRIAEGSPVLWGRGRGGHQ